MRGLFLAVTAFYLIGVQPITNRVKLHRMVAGGLTRAQLGEAVGVTRHTIIAIEQGLYSPSLYSPSLYTRSLETAFRIARHFGVGVEDVFG